MWNREDLKRTLRRIDGRGYKAYKAYRDIRGSYEFGDYILIIDHVQADPFASPSKVRVRVPQNLAGFPVFNYSQSNLCSEARTRWA